MLRTRITDLLHIAHPVMSAPMSNHSGGRLAAAVSRAGGLGSFGAINDFGTDWVREQIAYIRSQTELPFAVGFITHLIPTMAGNFEAAIEEQVPVIAFSFSDPKPWLGRAKEAGAITMCQVQTREGAKEAVDAGADVLVAQGNEAGGHTGSMNLLPLLTAIVEEFPQVPVMASGGIATGRALAAVLAAGAEGAWLGTAMLATPEAVEVPAEFKERVIQCDGQDTTFTRFYDLLGDPPWPPGIAGRVYRNRLVREWEGREEEVRLQREELASDVAYARARHDAEAASVYMGQSAGSVDAIRPAAQVLHDVCQQAEETLRNRTQSLLGRG
jgi:nitronate monooxygenase